MAPMCTSDIPTALYSAAQVREIDRRAIAPHNIAGAVLMQRAGERAFEVLRARFPRARRVVVVCGPGNNGGDGFVVARLAHEAGLAPIVLALGDPARAGADAAAMRAQCESTGIPVRPFAAALLSDVDVVVDALLGTGLERVVQGEWRAAIVAINESSAPVLAIDIPSGLQADTGAVMGAAVRADVALSYIGLKLGLFTGAGPEHVGEILFDDLGVPSAAYGGIAPLAQRLTESDVRGLIRRRARDAHKGSFGHVLVVGGAPGMSGAARLCAEAAVRSGAGLVTVATHPDHAAVVNVSRPELLVQAVRTAKDLSPLIGRATVLALGPGLSQTPWAGALYRSALASKLPLVIDADGLNLLARKPIRRNDWVLTPHPGEAARLLKTTTAVIQQNRLDAARKIVQRYGGVCVLKGAGTLIAADDTAWLCDRGNPGMASGGMGDVLTGMIAALRAQGLSALDAARLGVWLHASAGDDVAVREGETGLLANDLIGVIRRELNRLIA